jgi:hypothetical protein
MDKLENETWEEYAFRHELFEIRYADKEQQIIDDVCLPNPDDKFLTYNETNFTTIIWNKIQEIKRKYKMNGYDCNMNGFSYAAERRLIREDDERQKKLYALKRFWESKEKDIIAAYKLKRYNRYIELTKIISETHKEEFEEVLSMCVIIPYPPENTKEYQEYKEYQDKRQEKRQEKIKKEKKKRIELYEKYLKNKEIRLQIIELQQKINQLTCELV